MNCVDNLFIDKYDFDWEYYLHQNYDLVCAKINDLNSSYKHWLVIGCYENRVVRRLSQPEKIITVKLKQTQKFSPHLTMKYLNNKHKTLPQTPQTPQTQKNMKLYIKGQSTQPIKLNYKIAILVHLFNHSLLPFYVKIINQLHQNYEQSAFDIYINIVNQDTNYNEQYIQQNIKEINNDNVIYFCNENRGGDIGGLLLLSKYINDHHKDKYLYCMFFHSKTNNEWRKDMCQAVINADLVNLPKMDKVGLIGSKKWVHQFNYQSQYGQHFRHHFDFIEDMYKNSGISADSLKQWEFLAGTIFICKTEILQLLVQCQFATLYSRLNTLNSVDDNWVNIVSNILHKDTLGTGNDLMYRKLYGHPLHPDFQIEHAIERFIGAIVKHLGLKILGI